MAASRAHPSLLQASASPSGKTLPAQLRGHSSGLDAHKHFPLGTRVWWDGRCSGGCHWPVPSPGQFSLGGVVCVPQANMLLAVTITSL